MSHTRRKSVTGETLSFEVPSEIVAGRVWSRTVRDAAMSALLAGWLTSVAAGQEFSPIPRVTPGVGGAGEAGAPPVGTPGLTPPGTGRVPLGAGSASPFEGAGPALGPSGGSGPYGPAVPPPLGAPMSPHAAPSRGSGPPTQRMRDMSWIYIDVPKPRKVRVHDIITVMVDEKSEMTQNARFDRQRNAVLNAQLRSFIRLDNQGNLEPAAGNTPAINGQLRSQLNSFGTARSAEGLKYRIAATIVDVLPNGTLILEARKTIRTNSEVWEYQLTGRARSEDILANNTLLSENIAELDIAKRESGKVYDSAKRGWIQGLYDFLLPF